MSSFNNIAVLIMLLFNVNLMSLSSSPQQIDLQKCKQIICSGNNNTAEAHYFDEMFKSNNLVTSLPFDHIAQYLDNLYISNNIQSNWAKNLYADFLKSKMSDNKQSLEEKYLDAIALEHCRKNQNSFIAVIFPVAVGKDDKIESLINQCGPIILKKNIFLEKEGPFYFIKHLYFNRDWIGNWENDFEGIREVVRTRFPQGSGNVQIYLFECDSLEKIVSIKAMVRHMFGLGSSVMHSTDFQVETISLAQLVFNKNSLRFINKKKHIRCDKLEEYVYEFKKWIKRKNVDVNDFCAVGDPVLAAYGVNDCDQFSFVHHGHDDIVAVMKNQSLKSYNTHQNYHQFSIDDIIFNPENHFYYQDIKFATRRLTKILSNEL